jgi:hypothetical protein
MAKDGFPTGLVCGMGIMIGVLGHRMLLDTRGWMLLWTGVLGLNTLGIMLGSQFFSFLTLR